MTAAYKMLIGGERVGSETSLDVINPATGKVLAHVPDCSREQLDQAVRAARQAFPAWKSMPIEQRADKLREAAAVLVENKDELKRLLTSEQGKPHDEAEFEIMASAYWLTSFADMRLPVVVNEDTPERRSETRHVPLGVVGAIAPWNFPAVLVYWKLAPALIAGNTLMLKPSPFTPLTALRMAELLSDVFPPGVLNVVTGRDDLGPWITSHPDIDKISFTGSTATGRRVMASAAANLKKVTLELGGNDAAIVMPDVDIPTVAPALFWAAFRNSGQICIATKRMYIHADIYDELTRAIVDYAKTVKVGDGSEQGTMLGPIQNRQQYERVLGFIEEARENGFRFMTGGEVDQDAPGYFIPVTIVDNPPDDSRLVREEPFGPILPVLKFDDVDDVVRRANDSEYGLAGSVWSSDLEQAQAIAARLETGTVWINEVQHLAPGTAFAGHKQSGVGVENGMDGLLEYTVTQTISVKKPDGAA